MPTARSSGICKAETHQVVVLIARSYVRHKDTKTQKRLYRHTIVQIPALLVSLCLGVERFHPRIERRWTAGRAGRSSTRHDTAVNLVGQILDPLRELLGYLGQLRVLVDQVDQLLRLGCGELLPLDARL